MSTIHYLLVAEDVEPPVEFRVIGTPPFFYEDLVDEEWQGFPNPRSIYAEEPLWRPRVRGTLRVTCDYPDDFLALSTNKLKSGLYLRIVVGGKILTEEQLWDWNILREVTGWPNGELVIECGSQAAEQHILPAIKMFAEGSLDTEGRWRSLTPLQRWGWLRIAMCLMGIKDDACGSWRIDGRGVASEIDFYCALGEAIFGPFGYAGWNPQAMDERLWLASGSQVMVSSLENMVGCLDPVFWATAVEIAQEHGIRFVESER